MILYYVLVTRPANTIVLTVILKHIPVLFLLIILTHPHTRILMRFLMFHLLLTIQHLLLLNPLLHNLATRLRRPQNKCALLLSNPLPAFNAMLSVFLYKNLHTLAAGETLCCFVDGGFAVIAESRVAGVGAFVFGGDEAMRSVIEVYYHVFLHVYTKIHAF